MKKKLVVTFVVVTGLTLGIFIAARTSAPPASHLTPQMRAIANPMG